MPRFYLDQALTPGDLVTLSSIVAHIHVLRLKVGDKITLFNGDGHDYFAVIQTLSKRSVVVEILAVDKLHNESSLQLTLVIALINFNKFELVLQKAVELGVQKIVPIFSERTQGVNRSKLAGKYPHWQKIIIDASEQCGRAKLLYLDGPSSFTDALAQGEEEKATHAGHASITDSTHGQFILSPHHASIELNTKTELSSASLLVGPEGGFTSEEVSLAINHDYLPLAFGPRILRAETAVLVGVSYLQHRYGDLRKY